MDTFYIVVFIALGIHGIFLFLNWKLAKGINQSVTDFRVESKFILESITNIRSSNQLLTGSLAFVLTGFALLGYKTVQDVRMDLANKLSISIADTVTHRLTNLSQPQLNKINDIANNAEKIQRQLGAIDVRNLQTQESRANHILDQIMKMDSLTHLHFMVQRLRMDSDSAQIQFRDFVSVGNRKVLGYKYGPPSILVLDPEAGRYHRKPDLFPWRTDGTSITVYSKGKAHLLDVWIFNYDNGVLSVPMK